MCWVSAWSNHIYEDKLHLIRLAASSFSAHKLSVVADLRKSNLKYYYSFLKSVFTESNPYLLYLECVRTESDPQQHGSEKLDYRQGSKSFASYMANYKDVKYNKIIHTNPNTLYISITCMLYIRNWTSFGPQTVIRDNINITWKKNKTLHKEPTIKSTIN
jgi:hypothetical protein